jgi:hypothetical protein
MLEVDTTTTVDIRMERYQISYSSIKTDSLSTCLGILLDGSIEEKPFCFLFHTSQIDERDDDDPIDLLVYLLETLASYLKTDLNIPNCHLENIRLKIRNY